MIKFFLFLILLPCIAFAQYPDSTKHSTPALHNLTFSSLYATGGNVSNNQVGYFDLTTGKWNSLATAYGLWKSISSLSGLYQPLENQRLSTTNNVTHNNLNVTAQLTVG